MEILWRRLQMYPCGTLLPIDFAASGNSRALRARVASDVAEHLQVADMLMWTCVETCPSAGRVKLHLQICTQRFHTGGVLSCTCCFE